MKRRVLVTGFIALGVMLRVYFLEYRFQVLRCVHDVCQADGLLWSIGKDDTFPPGLFGPEHPLGVMGVYSRSGIPVVVGLIGGLLAPAFLIGGAIAVALNNKPRTLIAAGVAFLVLPIEYCVRIAY